MNIGNVSFGPSTASSSWTIGTYPTEPIHPRCECHECTQARCSFQWQMQQLAVFNRPALNRLLEDFDKILAERLPEMTAEEIADAERKTDEIIARIKQRNV